MVDGKVRVKTDIAAPSRDQYIASTQRAFERGAKTISDHADAFKVSHGSGEGVSSALPTPCVFSTFILDLTDQIERRKDSKEGRSLLRYMQYCEYSYRFVGFFFLIARFSITLG